MLHIMTERLVLKPHTQNSLVWLNKTFNDPDEDYFNGDDPPKEYPETLEETDKLLQRILNRPPGADILDYAIHKKETDELIGCGMIALINRPQTLFTGYWAGLEQGKLGQRICKRGIASHHRPVLQGTGVEPH